VVLNLHKLPKPYGRAKDIKDWPLLSDEANCNSLFEKERVRGWWPVAGKPKNGSKGEKKSDELVLKVRGISEQAGISDMLLFVCFVLGGI
jgi:hypothetical protein